jgi:G:T-mismatch repair DNA endonuclease (very short patch repair protein)
MGLKPLVLEVQGCIYHGCLKCFPLRQKKMPTGLTAEEAYNNTVAKNKKIEEHAELLTIWECDIYKELREDAEMAEFFDAFDFDFSMHANCLPESS